MKTWLAVFTATLLLTGEAAKVHGGTITYTIKDIGTSTTYTDMNTTNTFSGTGYVGMYGPNTADGASFVHLMGLEKSAISRTQLQVGTSALAGATIQSAVLSFMVVSGSSALQTITATSFTSGGVLGYNFDAPNVLGATTGTVRRSTAIQSINVTSLLASSVSSGSSWFALNLHGTYFYQYTWAWDDYYGIVVPDAAQMRLTVNYTTIAGLAGSLSLPGASPDTSALPADWADGNNPSIPVSGSALSSPEPSTIVSAGLAVLAGVFGLRRRRRV